VPFDRRSFLTRFGVSSAAIAALAGWSRRSGTLGIWAEEISSPSSNGNPIVVGKGLCDPQIRVYGGKVYLYATHDAVPGSDRFIMNDWWIWHSEDLVNWTLVDTLRPEETYWKQPCSECWATDAMARNQQFYFYFSRGPEEIGVVKSKWPTGPWSDPLGKPLIAMGSTPTKARDPGLLQEADGTTYIVFGCWDYYIAKLNEDMISLAETPRKILVSPKMGPYGPGKLDDKPFLHKRDDIYYLSWGCYYAMSNNVYGPYVYKESIIKEENTAPELQNHGRGLTSDRHGSFFELHNQWYFACNDKSLQGTSDHFRDSVISYVHYRDNGEIETIDLNLIGVGQYDASQPLINAADYFLSTGANVRQCPEGGYEVRDIHREAVLVYPNIRNIPAHPQIAFRFACGNPLGSSIEIWNGSDKLLGECLVPCTEGWNSYQNAGCKLNVASGKIDLRLVMRGGAGELIRLRSFRITGDD
jgi:arabinoxylan arabinofuranohydrolase